MPHRDSTAGSTIGRALTEARQAAGLELDDVAAQLRIRRDFLAALEEGRPDALPGVTYAIGYVRTYAAFLGLDVERAVTRFKQEAAGLEQRTELVFPSPAPEGRVPGVGLMLASVLLAGLAYGGWYWMSERGMTVHDMVPDVPERLATLIEGQDTTAPVPPAAAPSGTETRTAAASTPPQTGYRAANPSGVPVTARSSEAGTTVSTGVSTGAGDAAPTVADVEEDAAPTAASPIDVAAPVQESTTAPPSPVAEAEDPQPASAATEVADVTTTRPEPTPAVSAPDTSASTASASAASVPDAGGEPTQAQAATEPHDPVPSAPRLSGLIGASEAAVADPNQVPAPIERIVVRATGESWVQVRSEDGTTLFTRVLRNGDVYRVPDRSGLTLATGNAGALEVLVDGKPAPSLGTFGEVVRNIILEPARLAAGTAISGRN